MFQILAVDGTSLLHIPYDHSIAILQQTQQQCELIISQIVALTGNEVYRRNTLQQRDLLTPTKSKSINNLHDKSAAVMGDIELANNVQQLYRSPYRSPAEQYNCHQADEVDSCIEEKCLDEDDIEAAMQLKKMGSLKNFHRYPMGNLSPSKSLPEIAGVNIEIVD